MIQFAISDGAIGLLPQLLPHHPLDLMRVSEHFVEAAVGGDPLHGRFLADFVDADEVVAGLADERGDIRILRRLDAVSLEHGVAIVAFELGDPARIGVQQGDVVIDHLDRVAVTGHDQHAIPLLRTLRGERGEDVVGLEVFFGDRDDTHGVQRLLEERDLTDELGWRLATGAFVLGILAGAKGVTRDIESDTEVRGFLFLEQIDQHGDEAVNRIGVLTVSILETIDREGVKRPERQRVAVDYEKGRLFGVRHAISLAATCDTDSGEESRR